MMKSLIGEVLSVLWVCLWAVSGRPGAKRCLAECIFTRVQCYLSGRDEARRATSLRNFGACGLLSFCVCFWLGCKNICCPVVRLNCWCATSVWLAAESWGVWLGAKGTWVLILSYLFFERLWLCFCLVTLIRLRQMWRCGVCYIAKNTSLLHMGVRSHWKTGAWLGRISGVCQLLYSNSCGVTFAKISLYVMRRGSRCDWTLNV